MSVTQKSLELLVQQEAAVESVLSAGRTSQGMSQGKVNLVGTSSFIKMHPLLGAILKIAEVSQQGFWLKRFSFSLSILQSCCDFSKMLW